MGGGNEKRKLYPAGGDGKSLAEGFLVGGQHCDIEHGAPPTRAKNIARAPPPPTILGVYIYYAHPSSIVAVRPPLLPPPPQPSPSRPFLPVPQKLTVVHSSNASVHVILPLFVRINPIELTPLYFYIFYSFALYYRLSRRIYRPRKYL